MDRWWLGTMFVLCALGVAFSEKRIARLLWSLMLAVYVGLLIASCGDLDQLPNPAPPLPVYFEGMPADDVEMGRAMIVEWNRVVGSEVLYEVAERPLVGIVVRRVDSYNQGELLPAHRQDWTEMVDIVEYDIGHAECALGHEAGHRLGLRHVDDLDSVMHPWSCKTVIPTEADGELVRERWSL
jgi:hypothetical protein